MRIARITGRVTLARRLPELKPGALLLAEPLDGAAVRSPGLMSQPVRRSSPAPDALVLFDELGAGVGQLVAVSEGREATVPFMPDRVPIDAYCSAILDAVHVDEPPNQTDR